MTDAPGGSLKSLVGRWFGSFQLTRLLGAGAVGAVFLAKDHSLRRDVALKVLAKSEDGADDELHARFLREARAAARLVHPNVVQIYQIGEDEHFRFIAMEYVNGRTLHGTAKQEGGRLPEIFCIQRMGEAANALKLAASMGICHRDIKPANLLLTQTNTIKMTDFGLAAHIDASHTIGLANPSRFEGTPNYMSPEQWQQEPLTPKSDIYGLGCTFYHLLTGQTPYRAGNLLVCLQAHLFDPVPDPRALLPGLQDDFAEILMRCMAKPADERPEAGELCEALDELLHTRRTVELSGGGVAPALFTDGSLGSWTPELLSSRVGGSAQSMVMTRERASGVPDSKPAVSQAVPLQGAALDYRAHFGLRDYPFSDVRKPFLFWNEEPYQSILRALSARVAAKTLKLHTVLGASGSGRTFVCEMLKQRLKDIFVFPVEPRLLLGMRPLVSLCRQYGCFDVNPRASQQTLLDTFMSTALPPGNPNSFFVLLVDGMDAGDRELLAELDEILECASTKRMAMVLTGLESLPDELISLGAPANLLNGHPPLSIGRMSLKQMNEYLDFRMRLAGGSGKTLGLNTASQQLLHARSGGLPKWIHVHCHNALVFAALKNEKTVSFESIRLGLKSKSVLSPDGAKLLLQSG